MINLSERSYKKELLDDPSIPFADIQQNMKELNTINTYLGGHDISIAGLKKILENKLQKNSITICEIGCGGGDNLKAIDNWCKRNSIDVKFIGIDIKAECIEFARQQYPELKAEWMVADYKLINFQQQKPGIIFSSLFCHHFINEPLITMMQWMKKNAAQGFFINDLHRHVLAWYSIRMITAFFSKSYLVKNDAPLSVARGFTKKEWVKIMTASGIKDYSIQWKWAFRHLIVYHND